MAETTKVYELDTSQAVLGKENQDKTAEKEDTLAAVGFFQMFRFAERRDIIFMIIGTLVALILGAALPCFVLFWGDMTNSFGKNGAAIVDASKNVLFKFIYLAIGTFLMGWLMIYTWTISGERQAVKCRKVYFSRLLEQEIGWFDCNNQSELSVKFTTDTLAFQGGIGEKVAILVQVIGTFIGGFVIAFIKGWLMTLVVISSIPLISFAGYMYMSIIQVKDKRNKEFYNEAGAYSEQAISSIKTVKQLNGEDFEEKQYRDTLDQVQKKALRFALITAAAMGALNFASIISYSLGFWFGSNCIEQNSSCPSNIAGVSSPGDVLVVFFSILVASMNLSQMSPSMTKIAEAKMAAARIFSLLDRQPLIKNPPNAIKPTEFHGKIRLSHVKFAYPKDKSKIILNDISMDLTTTSTALIGESGSGKSTIIQLLMRFYDPDEGSITLDGFDLRQLDLKWLREQIGYVGQEPVLFASSILDNLKLGNEKASIKDINEALKQAEAYDFVEDLENKLDTFVGGGGNQISGGQKQRIAIARALLKKPKILLLDQATSALDRRNERLIQNTLNKISQSLMTITVAHRINTIKNAEYIYMLKKGEIDRKGTFKQIAPFIDSKIEEEKDSEKQEEKQEAPAYVNLVKHESKAEIVMSDKDAKKAMLKEIKEQLLLKHEKGIYRRIFGYNRQHCCLFIVGIIASVLLGMVYPVFSVFLSQIINTLFNLQIGTDHTQARKDADLASLVFLLLAIGSFILVFIQAYVFATVGQEITKNIREETYAKILKMPVPWFDYPENSTGTLSSRLATDCLTVNGILTNYVGLLIQSAATLIAGIIVAFIYDWRTSLTAFALMPLMILAGAMRAYFKNGLSSKGDQVYKESSNLIMESMVNIRTVVSFGVENTVMSKYSSMLDGTYESMTKTAFWTGVLYGLSQFLTNMCFALIFFIGSLYIENFGVTLLNVFTAIYAIFFAAITVGNNSHFMPDITEGKIAGASLFEILDSQDEEQIQVRENSKLLKEGINGNISLNSIAFKYESRNIDVFKNLTLEIKDGKKVAFVGPSGCGKSTIMQLLLRFYEPQAGTITINGENIKDYDMHYLRSVFGVVSQEPTLFNGSFRENIRYNCAKATEKEIRAAAEKANALIFIQGKEDDEIHRGVVEQHEEQKGFDRNVGIKGSHISGGQKQRVAIARAILREPQILLLDEATSALDNRNEKKVQDTLDKIMTHKTTITVAHRIETILNSDEIVVLEKGEIMERGTYAELMKLKRYFFNLQQGTQFL